MSAPRYIALGSAAERYDVSEKTLRRMITDGKITGYRFGRRLIRLDLNELESILRPIPPARISA